MSTLCRFKHLIGNTPILQVEPKIFAKFETYNPSGSVKDRMVGYIVDRALKGKELGKNATLLEATSGNTGISLAMIGARLNKKVKIIMPHNMSEERKQLMRLFGAEIIEVGFNDFKGAIALRDKMLKNERKYWSPLQFSNPLNIECHRKTTGPEISSAIYQYLRFEKKPSATFGAFIHGSGTGGTLMGVWEHFEKDIHITNEAGEPKKLDFVLTLPSEPSDQHGIQGINDGADFLLDKTMLSGEIKINTDDAIEYMKKLGRDKGLMVGISSAANILAAQEWSEKNPEKGNVITMLCDRGERYMQNSPVQTI
jgi:cysteine synthase A